jgi:hypothetical protein
MNTNTYAIYIMVVAGLVLGAAFVWLYFSDRKAQRAHDEWLKDLEQSRPKDYKTWSNL